MSRARDLMPRLPTLEEEHAIALAMAAQDGRAGPGELLDVREEVANAHVAVFDSYMSDGPGYTGRVAVVVWGGGPELANSFTFAWDKTARVLRATVAAGARL